MHIKTKEFGECYLNLKKYEFLIQSAESITLERSLTEWEIDEIIMENYRDEIYQEWRSECVDYLRD